MTVPLSPAKSMKKALGVFAASETSRANLMDSRSESPSLAARTVLGGDICDSAASCSATSSERLAGTGRRLPSCCCSARDADDASACEPSAPGTASCGSVSAAGAASCSPTAEEPVASSSPSRMVLTLGFSGALVDGGAPKPPKAAKEASHSSSPSPALGSIICSTAHAAEGLGRARRNWRQSKPSAPPLKPPRSRPTSSDAMPGFDPMPTSPWRMKSTDTLAVFPRSSSTQRLRKPSAETSPPSRPPR
mmetsp:Transcript_56264/g.163138  ORF Transcript_56264/g.163138 Transcript_56264/m.163138 type:complete len:249 (-) Transcript_56264:617-1363(-)